MGRRISCVARLKDSRKQQQKCLFRSLFTGSSVSASPRSASPFRRSCPRLTCSVEDFSLSTQPSLNVHYTSRQYTKSKQSWTVRKKPHFYFYSVLRLKVSPCTQDSFYIVIFSNITIRKRLMYFFFFSSVLVVIWKIEPSWYDVEPLQRKTYQEDLVDAIIRIFFIVIICIIVIIYRLVFVSPSSFKSEVSGTLTPRKYVSENFEVPLGHCGFLFTKYSNLKKSVDKWSS